MLQRLHIRNYAIIRELEVDWGGGLTIITGETGAGKSILLGALGLVLGKRADTSILYEEDAKCIVEAEFATEGFALSDFFQEHDIDREAVTTLRREVTPQGKSRAFINDTPVLLPVLRELAEMLIDVHSQHEVHTLGEADFRARFIDACADGGKAHADYRTVFQEWDSVRKRLALAEETAAKSHAEEDYLRFQLQELEELNLREDELSEVEGRLSELEHAEEIRTTLSNAVEAIRESERSLVDGLRQVKAELSRLARNYQRAEEWSQRLQSALIEMDDLTDELARAQQSVEDDPRELERLQERVDAINRLLSKHRLQRDSELMELRNGLSLRLQAMERSDEELDALREQFSGLGIDLQTRADILSSVRERVASGLSETLSAELHGLGMPDARIQISISRKDAKSLLGQDTIEVLFSANKGQALQDVSKVASGGELSRIMLVIKAEMARNAQLPTVIFDEIDTGVSGEVADRMGLKIKELSGNMQVLCITHLPQIAAKGDHHLFVFKEDGEGRTITRIRGLTGQDRVMELAKMLSSDNPTESAISHARHLVGQA